MRFFPTLVLAALATFASANPVEERACLNGMY